MGDNAQTRRKNGWTNRASTRQQLRARQRAQKALHFRRRRRCHPKPRTSCMPTALTAEHHRTAAGCGCCICVGGSASERFGGADARGVCGGVCAGWRGTDVAAGAFVRRCAATTCLRSGAKNLRNLPRRLNQKTKIAQKICATYPGCLIISQKICATYPGGLIISQKICATYPGGLTSRQNGGQKICATYPGCLITSRSDFLDSKHGVPACP